MTSYNSDDVATLTQDGFSVFKLLGYAEDDFDVLYSNLCCFYDGEIEFKQRTDLYNYQYGDLRTRLVTFSSYFQHPPWGLKNH